MYMIVMLRILLLLLAAFGVSTALAAQTPGLDYYLTQKTTYNTEIPTPESVLGWQVGKWHVSHDKLVEYMRALAASSDRIQLVEYGHTYEDRPLLVLVITSPTNHTRLEAIQQQHYRLTQPDDSRSLDTDDMPVVVYQGFSIHGNEPSGSNAALLLAYHLAAAQSGEVTDWLDDMVILLDPSLNPDGLQRFANWVNVHKSIGAEVTDPQAREFNEVWPRGRTNHYWFDLNRDWLPAQHPESQGRMQLFHTWKPNILTDHHEMGTNSTYFFQPGIASRTNPITPTQNQELTEEIATYHAAALDKIGSQYYTKESFDDFYYGKGSTYPDVNGAVGILFEQASSRGHAQESVNGILRFPFTIRNQLTTGLSTLRAGYNMRRRLLDYQRTFYQDAAREATRSRTRAYVFGHAHDAARVHAFAELLRRHDITVLQPTQAVSTQGRRYAADQAYVVPTSQPQYRLIRAIFEKTRQFNDSLFYDVSAWTLPLAYGLDYHELARMPDARALTDLPQPRGTVQGGRSTYGYLLPWDGYYAPRALYRLQAAGLRTKVAGSTFSSAVGQQNRDFTYGTIFVPVQGQPLTTDAMYRLLQSVARDNALDIYAVKTGFTPAGIDLGSPSLSSLTRPEVMIAVGGSVRANDAGELWYLLDQRYHIPASLVTLEAIARADLSRYTHIILPSGSYTSMPTRASTRLKDWVRRGGTLVALGNALYWTNGNGLTKATFKSNDATGKTGRRPYAMRSNDSGAQYIGGAIFESTADVTHPLLYGYRDDQIYTFRRNRIFIAPPDNAYAAPMVYTTDPIVSGYISTANLRNAANSAPMVVYRVGSGRTIAFTDNPAFRAFWYGTDKLLANALFFGSTISSAAMQPVE